MNDHIRLLPKVLLHGRGGFQRGRRLAFVRTARRERVSRSGAWPRCALLRAAIFALASAGRGWRTSPRRSSAAGRPRGRGRQRQAGRQGAYRAPSGSLNATPRWRGQDVRRRHVFCADWRPAFAGRDTSGGRRHPQGSDVLPPVPEHDRRNRRNVAGYRCGCRRRACRGGRRVGVRRRRETAFGSREDLTLGIPLRGDGDSDARRLSNQVSHRCPIVPIVGAAGHRASDFLNKIIELMVPTVRIELTTY